jgi:hypothetical protein
MVYQVTVTDIYSTSFNTLYVFHIFKAIKSIILLYGIEVVRLMDGHCVLFCEVRPESVM